MAKIKTASRTISNAGPGRTLVNVATTKAVGDLPTESLVEFDGLIELIADPDIVSVQVQPETFQLEVNAKVVRYTPDVRFVRRDGRIGYREFKDVSKPLDPAYIDKLQAFGDMLADREEEFEVRHSDQLRKGFRLRNLKLLHRYANWPAPEEFQQGVLAFVGDRTCELHELRLHVGPGGLGPLYRMLWDQRLDADLAGALLCGATRVRRGSR